MSIKPNIDRHVFRPSNIPFSSKSQTVLEVLGKFPNPLADGEAEKIEKVVDDMVFRGVWQQHDYFFGWFLTDETNALTSWKGTKTATNVSDALFSRFGVLTDGSSSYIDPNITFSTDLTNAKQNDFHAETYCYDNLDDTTFPTLFGAGTASNNTFLIQTGTTTVNARVNVLGSSSDASLTETDGKFQDRIRYGIHRNDSANHEIYKME